MHIVDRLVLKNVVEMGLIFAGVGKVPPAMKIGMTRFGCAHKAMVGRRKQYDGSISYTIHAIATWSRYSICVIVPEQRHCYVT